MHQEFAKMLLFIPALPLLLTTFLFLRTTFNFPLAAPPIRSQLSWDGLYQSNFITGCSNENCL